MASPTVHRICHDYCKGPEALSSNFRATELQIRAILICTAWQDEKETHLGVTNDVPVVIEHVEADDRTLHLRAAEVRVTVNLHDWGSVGVPQGGQGRVGVLSQGKGVLPDLLHSTSGQ